MARAVVVTGGIGSGKSTVSALLAAWGAHVVDADRLSREVVEPGSEGLAEVARAFGAGMLAVDGKLDRSAMAEVVFADPDRRAQLESIIHPRVEQLAEQRLAEGKGAPLIVYEVPLLGRRPRFPKASAAEGIPVVVVDVSDDDRRARLLERGLPEDQITLRMAAQPTREQWRDSADVLIDNTGDLGALRDQVAALWTELTGTPAPVGGAG